MKKICFLIALVSSFAIAENKDNEYSSACLTKPESEIDLCLQEEYKRLDHEINQLYDYALGYLNENEQKEFNEWTSWVKTQKDRCDHLEDRERLICLLNDKERRYTKLLSKQDPSIVLPFYGTFEPRVYAEIWISSPKFQQEYYYFQQQNDQICGSAKLWYCQPKVEMSPFKPFTDVPFVLRNLSVFSV